MKHTFTELSPENPYQFFKSFNPQKAEATISGGPIYASDPNVISDL